MHRGVAIHLKRTTVFGDECAGRNALQGYQLQAQPRALACAAAHVQPELCTAALSPKETRVTWRSLCQAVH